jgi:hypothetical protein
MKGGGKIQKLERNCGPINFAERRRRNGNSKQRKKRECRKG